MLVAWRYVRRQYAPLDGQGSALYGGRWNPPGVKCIYCAETKALSYLEYTSFVSPPDRDVENDILFYPIVIPPLVSRTALDVATLPADWRAKEELTREMGREWVSTRRSCVLAVPSSLIPRERYILINPEHDDFTHVVAGPPETLSHNANGVEDILALMKHKQIFLCHASEDKAAIARPLFEQFTLAGISCWLDEAEILWGDSITAKVNEGFQNSRYVVVVLTPNFLKKNWPKAELFKALNKEISSGATVVLPLIAGTSDERKAILSELDLLNDKRYVEWTGDPQSVVAELQVLLRAT